MSERVLLVAVYYRPDPTMRQLAPLFGVSPATVCRVLQRSGPLLAREPVPPRRHLAERPWIVDGTFIPVRDRAAGTSSRTYRFSANVRVIVDADTRLVIAAARPVPGTTANAEAWRESGPAARYRGVAALGDGAYLNTGLIVPHRERPGRPLLRTGEDDNAAHRRVRARVEHVISRMKNCKILRDCRQRGNGLHHTVQAVAHMPDLALAA